MAYSELIKNFEKVRAYMREFYVYGFKSRTEYSKKEGSTRSGGSLTEVFSESDESKTARSNVSGFRGDKKSARSYDDERRRIESWLGDYMRFTKTAEGKNVFLSVDSRSMSENPFYKAWKTKSFTDGDITLHFILFDILYDDTIRKTLSELLEEIDDYLCGFSEPMTFDESTVRKKLKEYVAEGIIQIEKEGRKVVYRRMPDVDIANLSDILDFFSETAPCGVIGSFLKDKQDAHPNLFSFKHHYMTGAMDSDIMANIFAAMREKRYITVDNLGKRFKESRTVRLVPLNIYISAQNGRQNLIAYHEKAARLSSYRLDYLSKIRIEEECPSFDDLRKLLREAEAHMWGVNCKKDLSHLEHVEFEVYVGDNENHIIRRLEREKRCGSVEKIDEHHYRYTADVFDTGEMIPWIRTYISRITKMNFSNRTIENRFKEDIAEMYRMYGIEEGDTT